MTDPNAQADSSPNHNDDTLKRAATSIVQTLQDAGHTAYFAGGCVRDTLLGFTPKDYDIATDAKPEIVRKLFSRSRYVGESFGVVLVYINHQPLEVATFRKEWGYTDGRRPDEVAFTDAEHDAQRRDFTINGLFSNPLDLDQNNQPTIIDFIGGIKDLDNQLIRAIGNPDERFAEDYLRMLRAVRFAARFDFPLEINTANAIITNAPNLKEISRERIGQELRLMLTGQRPALAAKLIQDLKLDNPILGEPHKPAKLITLSSLKANPPYPVALAAWLLDRLAPTRSTDAPISLQTATMLINNETIRPILKRIRKSLCLSNEDRDVLQAILLDLSKVWDWASLTPAHRKRLLATPHWNLTHQLAYAIQPDAFMQNLDKAAEQLRNDPIGLTPDPLITGDDLIAEDFTPSPSFRIVLDKVYDAQLEGLITTREQAIQLAHCLYF
ncbi:CCA tRNA nucleotidyltransferase [Poriferisphaera corsica]|nr:CCA tRNA nucleotidyltransferase [Poriferisphaera corsica]